MQAVVLTGFYLVADIDLAGRIVADENNCQAGLLATGGQGGGTHRDIGAKGLGKGIAVDDLGSHRRSGRRKLRSFSGGRMVAGGLLGQCGAALRSVLNYTGRGFLLAWGEGGGGTRRARRSVRIGCIY